MSFSPLVWKSFDISEKSHQQLFLGQLADLLNFLNSAQGLSTLLNGSFALGASALNLLGRNLGIITTNQTVNCGQVASAMVVAQVSTVFSPTISLTNFPLGANLTMRFANGSGANTVWKIAATTPGGTAYSIAAYSNTTGLDMVNTGITIPAGQVAMFSGASYPNTIEMLVNLT